MERKTYEFLLTITQMIHVSHRRLKIYSSPNVVYSEEKLKLTRKTCEISLEAKSRVRVF